MKYLVDKALSPKTVKFLVDNEFDAQRVDEVISGTKVEDIRIFKYAINNNMVIITADLDFGKILAFTRLNKPSTIILRLNDPRISNVNQKLIKNLPNIQNELQNGSLIIIEEYRIRVKSLPIGK